MINVTLPREQWEAVVKAIDLGLKGFKPAEVVLDKYKSVVMIKESLKLADDLYNYLPEWDAKPFADMLRQQADRIKELEKYVGFKDSGYEIISANAPRELSDEEITKIAELGLDKFRAILQKASEK